VKVGIGAFVTDLGIGAADLARATEERGFESLLVTEHSHIPVRFDSVYPNGGEMPHYYRHCLDPFAVLATAAAVTTRLTLGTGITLVVQRDVIQLAKEVATIDYLSGGRFLFGVGAGWHREEMANHGTDPKTRGALLDEQLQALRAIWSRDEAEFHGRYVNFDPIYSYPKPVQRPHPPIYIGGMSPATFDRIDQLGDGWIAGSVTEAKDVAWQLGLATGAAAEKPVTVFAADYQSTDVLKAYRDGGAERVALLLEPAPEESTLRQLDDMAALIDQLA
jgi:probable F420-dependent oxidoreductase